MELLLGPLVWLGSVVVCAIPARYRRWWPVKNDADLRGPAIVSGAIEFLAGAVGSMFYVAGAIQAAKMGLGVASLILSPNLSSVFLFIEGMIRTGAAVGSGQALPTLPLQIVAWIHDAREGKLALEALGPPVPDVVERGKGSAWDLRVVSCRQKTHWNSYMTVRFEGDFYQMFKEDRVPGARQFVYLLRKNPTGRLVVVVYEYFPDDVLKPPAVPEPWSPGNSP